MALSRAKHSSTRRKRLHCRLGIFGIGDLNKIHCGTQKNVKYLDGKRDLTATREVGFTKIWTPDAGNILPFRVGNSRNAQKLRINQARDQWCLLCYLVFVFVSSALPPPPLRHTKIWKAVSFLQWPYNTREFKILIEEANLHLSFIGFCSS